MTPAARVDYRKLPGHRRGIIRGASLWAGPDHLLLVRSYRFREEYKRFYYRDVQAVSVAHAPRFHISTRALAIGGVWWIAAAILFARWHVSPAAGGAVLLVLALAWAYISGMQSCRCRIYTAVSSDELPSIYRRWTARKFLAALDPLIAQAQGVLEGPWAEAAEERGVGPAEPRIAAVAEAQSEQAMPARTVFSDLFIGGLFADAVLHFFPPASAVLLRWSTPLITAAMVAGAIGVIIQRRNGKIRGAMQKLAIAAVVSLGVMYYVQALSVGFMAGAAAGRKGSAAVQVPMNVTSMEIPVVRQIRGGIETLLGIAGIVFSLASREEASLRIVE